MTFQPITKTSDELINDTRTRAEKIGDIPVKFKVIQPIVKPKTDSAMKARAKRNAARELALDYSQWAIHQLRDEAENSQSASARIDALKQLLNFGLGKPATVHVDVEGHQITPNFTISFGEQPATIQANYQVIDESDDGEES
jgi:hypothetical protein